MTYVCMYIHPMQKKNIYIMIKRVENKYVCAFLRRQKKKVYDNKKHPYYNVQPPIWKQ